MKNELNDSTERFLSRLLGGDFLLWSPNVQAEGFLNWDKIWATRTIRRGTPKPLPYAPITTNFTFESHGKTRTIEDFMRWEFVSGLLVVKGGEIKLEHYARGLTPERCWQSSSMVKSFAAILVGAAVEDGAIRSIQQPITDYLPELLGSAYEGVTIHHLLKMASGVFWTELTDDPTTDVTEHYLKPIAARKKDYVLRYLKSRPREYSPGSRYRYNSADVLLLSYILSRATGCKVADYCSAKIWRPVGFEQDGYFMLDADDGQEVLGSCSGACLRDYARWGLLMLADGIVEGKRVLPQHWVKDCVTAKPPIPVNVPGQRGESVFNGYGYLWWVRGNGDYAARGSFGQWIYVSPKHNAVVTILGAVPRLAYMSTEERDLHEDTSHGGSKMRLDFIAAILNELN